MTRRASAACRDDALAPQCFDFRIAVAGFGEDFLLQAPGRRLVVGRGARGGRSYHAFRLADERQLADVRAFVEAQGIATLPCPAAAMRADFFIALISARLLYRRKSCNR